MSTNLDLTEGDAYIANMTWLRPCMCFDGLHLNLLANTQLIAIRSHCHIA